MTFTKGHKLAHLGTPAREEGRRRTNEVVIQAITGGFLPYEEKLRRLEAGEELTKPEQEYMDRIEKWIEHQIPKLGRTELTGANGEKLITDVKITIVENAS